MKKFYFIVIVVIFCNFLIGCRILNLPYQNRMKEYYSNDNNYIEVEGKIVEIYSIDSFYLSFSMKYEFECASSFNKCQFRFYSHKEIINFLAEGDEIRIISATRCFYDGHIPPIVSLEVNENVLLTFEEGKSGLLDWIDNFA